MDNDGDLFREWLAAYIAKKGGSLENIYKSDLEAAFKAGILLGKKRTVDADAFAAVRFSPQRRERD